MQRIDPAGAAAIIYYKLPDGHLYHWVVDSHGAKDTVESLTAHIEKWIPSAEFVEARIEKMNLINRDTANYHERMRWALYMAQDAAIIETSDGHYFGLSEGAWYAYPNTGKPRRKVPGWHTTGNEVIRAEDGKPKEFKTAIEAYQACLEAAGYFDKIAEIERRQREVVECSAAL